MKDSKLSFTTQIFISGVLTTVTGDIIRTSDTQPGMLHGKKLIPGFHIEISVPNLHVPKDDLEKTKLVDLYSNTRKHAPCFIVDETWETKGLLSFLGAINRMKNWIALNSKNPKKDSLNLQASQAGSASLS